LLLLWCVEKNVSSSLCDVVLLCICVVSSLLFHCVLSCEFYCVFHGTLWCFGVLLLYWCVET
jgi:hypothetical protein